MEKDRILSFRFITFCIEQAFFQPVKKGMEDAARSLGVSCSFTGVEGIDNAAQAKAIEAAVRDGVDGIAVNLPSLNGFENALSLANANHIPIVGFNDDVRGKGDLRLAHVSQRLLAAGTKLGRRAAAHIAKGAHIIISLHSDGAQALEQRVEGIVSALSPMDITYHRVVTTTDPEESRDILLAQCGASVSSILATGQADTQGAGLAAELIKKRENKKLYVCGFDTSDEILRMVAEGTIDFTIGQQPYAQGYYPVHMLYLYAKYGIVPMDMDAGAPVIDRQICV